MTTTERLTDRAAALAPEVRPRLGEDLVARRLVLLVPTALLTLLVAALAVAATGLPDTVLEGIVLGLFVSLVAWHAFVAWQYVMGLAVALMPGRFLSGLERRSVAAMPVAAGPSRTAVTVPIHAEDPAAVFSGLRIMARSLRRAGAEGIDLFVLSDTRDAAIAAAEERELAAFQAWASGEAGLPLLRYRRRAENGGRKAGNIAEFCARHGGAYDFMIVLDADSLMTGETMLRLVRLMEENPRLGLVQTVSYAAGRDTLFARMQQFAVRLYAPLGLRCLDAWQGPEGSYWGHNAILRIAPFMEHCRLPVLSGRPPLGGEILCHDIVEGALLRRAGYEVRLLPELGGTWEEMPTNVVDLFGRERRWCQGNLQHLRVIGWPGLKAASRGHLAVGILAYLAAPLWVAFLAAGTLQAALSGDLGLLAYGLTGGTAASAALFALVAAIFAAPKLLSLAHVLADRERRALFGGAGPLLAGAALEQVLWIALWPPLTLFNAGAVVMTFAGRVVRWDAQSRDDRRLPWREALRLQRGAVAAGLLLGAGVILAGDGALALWMLPVAALLVLAPATAVGTSRVDLGHRSRRAGLFLTQDDTATAPELVELVRGRSAAARP